MLTTEQHLELATHLKTILSTGLHEVVFTKANGDLRTLKGTRDSTIIGEELFESYMNPPLKTDGTPRAQSTTSMAIYDIEAKGFRSFKFDNLISVNGVDINNFLNQGE